ncbi:hypothetical protein JRQ81_008423 [Phrynocephalus forsythii]|uniref:Uncharacterized protein n=1 Tax=Phrynocephalus forsythii TaxID=171643 RepID=A0A9Q1ATE5_9SAUR|nr:hypothetical protein JRQ81_008423 [Phrynocephalus forsythii]
MGEPAPWPPPPPTGAPILLALLSLVGSGAPGDGGPIYFQRDLPSGEPQREGYSPIPLQPLALVLRDAAQQRPKAELAQDVSPFTRPPSARRLERSWSGHRILKPATLPAKIRGFCRNHRAQDFERLFRRREQKKISERQPLSRHRRAFPWPGRLPSLRKGLGGQRDLVTLTPAHATVAPSLLVVKKDIPEPSRPGGEGHLTTPPHSGHQASLPALSTEDGAAHATGCLCPSRDLQKAQGQLGKT